MFKFAKSKAPLPCSNWGLIIAAGCRLIPLTAGETRKRKPNSITRTKLNWEQ
jgi:hypothetical protein